MVCKYFKWFKKICLNQWPLSHLVAGSSVDLKYLFSFCLFCNRQKHCSLIPSCVLFVHVQRCLCSTPKPLQPWYQNSHPLDLTSGPKTIKRWHREWGKNSVMSFLVNVLIFLLSWHPKRRRDADCGGRGINLQLRNAETVVKSLLILYRLWVNIWAIWPFLVVCRVVDLTSGTGLINLVLNSTSVHHHRSEKQAEPHMTMFSIPRCGFLRSQRTRVMSSNRGWHLLAKVWVCKPVWSLLL